MKTLLRHLFVAGSVLVASVSFSSAHATGVVNLLTSEAGMYRISYEQLRDQGVDLQGVKYRRVSLTHNGQPVSIRAQAPKGSRGSKAKYFGSGGFIEFYAEATDSLYSQQRAYTLHLTKDFRDTIKSVSTQYNPTLASATTYTHTQVIEKDTVYDSTAPSATDPWHYGSFFSFGGGSRTYDFTLDNVAGNAQRVEAQVYGLGEIESEGNDHHYKIAINGNDISADGEGQQFDGHVSDTMVGTDVAVNNGDNTVELQMLSLEGVPFDTMALNQLTIEYQRTTQASGDYLEGYFDSVQAEVSNFSTNKKATVYRKDADGTIVRIKKGVKKLGQGRTGFNTNGVAGHYIVVGENGYKTPNVALLNDDADLNGSAEYLIITHSAFQGADLDALVQLRQADYSVKVVDVNQIYGQFGNHVPDANAIRAYINYAVANLGTQYVTLIGADTYDYFQRTTESISFVPTLYVSTRAGGALRIHQTPSDAQYGDVDNDGVPEIPVGRISARTPEELGFVVEKIRDYQARENYAGRILMAAGREDVGNGLNFMDDANEIINAISEPVWRNAVANANRANFRAYPDLDGDAATKAKVTTAINDGVSVAAYIGHSSQLQWSLAQSYQAPMLAVGDLQTLTNIDKPALVTQWGCWNTYFVDPDGNTMADRFLVGGENGAVSVLGASSLTTSSGERVMGIELNKRLYQPGVTVGQAVIAAKQALAQQKPDADDILLGYQILGDPALKVNP